MTVCKICVTDADHPVYDVREMQFGTREEFKYFQCTNCRCLQIADIPGSISKYYPRDYFSFQVIPSRAPPGVTEKLRKLRRKHVVEYKLSERSTIGKFLTRESDFVVAPYWLKEGLNLSTDSRVLDVGSGSGKVLLQLENIGFKHLLGVDPFINEDVTYRNGVRVLKTAIEHLDDSFDFIMMHHSFEHMRDPLRTLKKVNDLLRYDQYLLIRIPTCSSQAWNQYGVNWVQIDAPRHFFIHSIESIDWVAKEAGFQRTEVIFDSNDFQFWGSEQYAQDIPMNSERSYQVNPENSIFSQETIEAYVAKAAELNRKQMGDQACFYFRKVSKPTRDH